MPYISLLVQSSLPGPPPRRLAVLSTPCRPIGPSHRPVHHLARRLARRLSPRLAHFALSLLAPRNRSRTFHMPFVSSLVQTSMPSPPMLFPLSPSDMPYALPIRRTTSLSQRVEAGTLSIP